MSDYWKSNPNWFCPQCKIYIADNKASRDQHVNGLKHKGNVQRAIDKINKDARQKIKNQKDEAAVLAQVNAAVGDTSAPPPPKTSKKPERPKSSSNPYANYSTAASLGMVDHEWEASVQAAKEAKAAQGSVGSWQTVQPVASTSRASGLQDPEDFLSATAREEARPTSKTFKEKTLDQDELWDPALSIKLKSDRTVKTEELPVKQENGESSQTDDAPLFKKKKGGFKAAFNKDASASASPVPEVKQEDDSVEAEVKAEADAPPAPAPTMFKKRKGGSNSTGVSQRRKLD